LWFCEEPGGFDSYSFDYSQIAQKTGALVEFPTTASFKKFW